METKGKRSLDASGTGPIGAETPADAPAFAVPPVEPAIERHPRTEGTAPDPIDRRWRDALAALGESQTAMARGLTAIGDAMARMIGSGIDIAAVAATAMIEVKTISGAVDINARLAGRLCDGLLDGSAELSRLGVELAADSSRPLLAHLAQR